MNLPVPQQQPQQITIVRPIAKPAAMIEAHKELVALIDQTFQVDLDYGTIPGTNRPTLLKPGAERLCKAFGAAAHYQLVQSEVDHEKEVKWQKRKKACRDGVQTWNVEEGTSLGLYRYIYKCQIILPDGRIIGEGEGSCSTLESKYADRPRECENTVLKMAQKRALVAASLNAFGLSSRFTQDVEDLGHGDLQEPSASNQPSQNKTAQIEPIDIAVVGELPNHVCRFGSVRIKGKKLKDCAKPDLESFLVWAKDKDGAVAAQAAVIKQYFESSGLPAPSEDIPF